MPPVPYYFSTDPTPAHLAGWSLLHQDLSPPPSQRLSKQYMLQRARLFSALVNIQVSAGYLPEVTCLGLLVTSAFSQPVKGMFRNQ